MPSLYPACTPHASAWTMPFLKAMGEAGPRPPIVWRGGTRRARRATFRRRTHRGQRQAGGAVQCTLEHSQRGYCHTQPMFATYVRKGASIFAYEASRGPSG